MFHRVLGAGDERWAHADPRYTITDEQLEQCIEFFGNHYTLVDIAAVQAAARGQQALPARALLVTFDDGWADTEEYALPVLLRRRCPAVVVVVSSAVGASHGLLIARHRPLVPSARLALVEQLEGEMPTGLLRCSRETSSARSTAPA